MVQTAPKRVQFACNVEFISTFADDDYDRSAQAVAKLTYHDMMELLTMRSQWRRDTERLMAQRELEERAAQQPAENDTSNKDQQHVFGTSPYEICT